MIKAVGFKLIGVLGAVLVGGCGDTLYSKLPPAYDLTANQDKQIIVWIESPRSAGADVDAGDNLAEAIRNHLVLRANIKPENLFLARDLGGGGVSGLLSPEAVAEREGIGLVLFVRMEAYELQPLGVRNYHSGRMLTRAILLEAGTGRPLWPATMRGKLHDIVVELSAGDRQETLVRMSQGTAHCIVRNLYPIQKLHYKNSDERISVQEVFDMETF